jgi:uncharacterized damage-inducible protein DinB
MNVESLFLEFSTAKLLQFTGRIEVCLDKLTEAQIWTRGGQNQNAIGNLALHLNGNVRQWIVTTLGNEPFARDRDSEFNASEGHTAADLGKTLRQTIEEAVQVISGLDTDRLTRTYEIQNYRVSGVEVVYHVVEHFAEHTGQIIYATKALTGEDMGFYRHLRTTGQSEQAP